MPTSTPPPPAERSRDAGFTLVELLVVLALVGLAAGAVVVSLPRGPDAPARAVADRLAVRIAAVRDQAVVAQRPATVSFDQAGYRFSWDQAGTAGAQRPLPVEDGAWGPDVRASASTGRITFDALGLPDQAASVRLGGVGEGAGAGWAVRIAANGDVAVARP